MNYDVIKLQEYQLWRHFGDVIKLHHLKYVIKISSQKFSIFKPLLNKILVAYLPQTPAILLPPTITTLSSSLLSLNAFHYPSKKSRITPVNVLLLFLPHFSTYFSLQSLQFLLTGGVGARIFLAPGRKVP